MNVKVYQWRCSELSFEERNPHTLRRNQTHDGLSFVWDGVDDPFQPETAVFGHIVREGYKPEKTPNPEHNPFNCRCGQYIAPSVRDATPAEAESYYLAKRVRVPASMLAGTMQTQLAVSDTASAGVAELVKLLREQVAESRELRSMLLKSKPESQIHVNKEEFADLLKRQSQLSPGTFVINASDRSLHLAMLVEGVVQLIQVNAPVEPDPHAELAALILGVSVSEVLLRKLDPKDEEVFRARQLAKLANFTLPVLGLDWEGLVVQARVRFEISLDETSAKKLIAMWQKTEKTMSKNEEGELAVPEKKGLLSKIKDSTVMKSVTDETKDASWRGAALMTMDLARSCLEKAKPFLPKQYQKFHKPLMEFVATPLGGSALAYAAGMLLSAPFMPGAGTGKQKRIAYELRVNATTVAGYTVIKPLVGFMTNVAFSGFAGILAAVPDVEETGVRVEAQDEPKGLTDPEVISAYNEKVAAERKDSKATK